MNEEQQGEEKQKYGQKRTKQRSSKEKKRKHDEAKEEEMGMSLWIGQHQRGWRENEAVRECVPGRMLLLVLMLRQLVWRAFCAEAEAEAARACGRRDKTKRGEEEE